MKIEVPWRIARDRSDVVKSWNFAVHQAMRMSTLTAKVRIKPNYGED
jgi:hypothetical protein